MSPSSAQLIELRHKLGLTVKQIASLIYYKEAVWYHFENATRNMPLRSFELLNYKINDPEMEPHLVKMRESNEHKPSTNQEQQNEHKPSTNQEQQNEHEPVTDHEQ